MCLCNHKKNYAESERASDSETERQRDRETERERERSSGLTDALWQSVDEVLGDQQV